MSKFITADPRFEIHYISYYLIGLKRSGFRISYNIIPDFPLHDKSQLARGMAFIQDGKKVFVDTNDHNTIDELIYAWCDVYAKINVRPEDVKREKILAIGPSFSVRFSSPFKTILLGVLNYIRSWGHWGEMTRPSFTSFMKGYIYTLYRRTVYSQYEQNVDEQDGYVFTMNTLWYDKFTDSVTNRMRGVFALTSKRLVNSFEGGFFFIDNPNVVKVFPEYEDYLVKYQDILTTQRVGMLEYIQKTQRSSFVFNCPAVSGCHGWKLGEYLAMGKAMISIKPLNAMPGNFIPGHHYVLVRDETEVEEAVIRLTSDKNFRDFLKKNVREYFKEYLSPEAVINRIFF